MKLQSNGLISLEINGEIYDYKLKAEEKLGFKITEKVGNGTVLTENGLELLDEYRKYTIQIEKTENINIAGGHISSGLLESISQPFNINVYSSSDEDAFELARRGVVDIITLDDPLIAYERDINFTPIAYDYLVLISSPDSKEIKSINALGIETECFIHGSMCYAYSGQCLFSSFLGGRSGNRGRCAGPCRQPYSLTKNGKEQYLISLKDLCTLHILPKLIDAGISSFKIEGRMKAPAYAAGTAKIYRKYIDLYYDKSREYKVEDNDLKDLYGLYLHSDLQEGYYEKVKGKEMVSLHSPSYNKTNEELCNQITESFCRRQIPVILNASAKIVAGENASITISMPDGNLISVNGDVVDVAKKAPLTEESLKERFMKSSEGLYAFRLNEICLGDGNAFLPVGAINALRRNAESILQNKLRENYQDRRIVEDYSLTDSVSGIDDNETTVSYRYFVTTLEQFNLSLAYAKEGDGICIPATFMEIPLVLDTIRKEYSQDN